MERKLPKGWLKKFFTEILDIQGGTQPPKEVFISEERAGYIRLLQIRDFGEKPVPTYIPIEANLKTCSVDDILIARYGASIGRIVTGHAGAYNVALAKVIIPELINRRFIFWLLKSPLFQINITSFQRTAQNGFNKEDLSGLEIPLPPLPEQQRIVAKLDTLFGQLNKIKTHLERIPQLLKDFRQKVLTQAVTGKLTEEWREGRELENEYITLKRFLLSSNPSKSNQEKIESIFDEMEIGLFSIPDKWIFANLNKVCSSFSYGTSEKSDNDGLIPVLRMGNLQNGKIDWSDLKYSSNKEEIEKYKLKAGDVLFNRTNSPELVGKTSIYRGEMPAIYAGYLIKIEVIESFLDPEYLNISLNTEFAKNWCWSVKSDGVSQSNINAQKLARFVISLPSIEEQQEIVRRVESLFAKADKIEASYQKLKAKIEQLPQAILTKAFRGELVEQLPTDGDARGLLEQIKLAKEGLEKGGKNRKLKGDEANLAAEPRGRYGKEVNITD